MAKRRRRSIRHLQKKAIGNGGADRLPSGGFAQAGTGSTRQDIGELARNDEDALSYAMFPEVGELFLEQRASR